MHQQVVRSARREQPRFPLLHTCASYALQSDTLIFRPSYVVHSSASTAPARTVSNAVPNACAVVAILTRLRAQRPASSTFQYAARASQTSGKGVRYYIHHIGCELTHTHTGAHSVL